MLKCPYSSSLLNDIAEQLAKIFRPPTPVMKRIISRSDTNSPAAFPQGPAATKRHPWTGRQDNGINSRVITDKGTDERGFEIYYVGVIDILQQYNTVKRAENFFKVYNKFLLFLSLLTFFLLYY